MHFPLKSEMHSNGNMPLLIEAFPFFSCSTGNQIQLSSNKNSCILICCVLLLHVNQEISALQASSRTCINNYLYNSKGCLREQ